MPRYLIPAFLCITAASESEANDVAESWRTKLAERDPGARVYLDEELPTLELRDDDELRTDEDPHTLMEICGLDVKDRSEQLETALGMFMGDMYRFRNRDESSADAWALVDDLDASYDAACSLCPDMLAKAEAENKDEHPDDASESEDDEEEEEEPCITDDERSNGPRR